VRRLLGVLLGCLVACTTAPKGVKLVNAPPGARDVAALVRDTQAQASLEHRWLVVYVGAKWCHPCQVIHAAAESGKLDAAFPDLELLVFDLDRDRESLEQAGYDSRLIPLFAIPGPDGRASARRAEGGIEGEGNLELLTGKLHRLLGDPSPPARGR
jgi:hypothetical protein